MESINQLDRIIVNPKIIWVVEGEGVSLFLLSTEKKISLKYPEAALWDFAVRDVPLNRVEKNISAILKTDISLTRKWITGVLDVWLHNGYILKR